MFDYLSKFKDFFKQNKDILKNFHKHFIDFDLIF